MTTALHTILTDRAVLAISGDDAATFLQGLVTNDINRVMPGRAVYAALLTPQGKILFDFFIVADDGSYLIDCAAAHAADLAKRLTFYKLRASVDIADRTYELAVAAIWPADGTEPVGGDTIAVFPDPRTPAAGFRAIGPRDALEGLAAENGLARADLETYHAHRVALGLADSERDIGSGEMFPHECNLDQINGVDFKKGCYVGQEVVSRTEHRSSARKRIVPVTADGGALEPGADLSSNGKTIGTVLSGSGDAALALIRLDRARNAHEAGTPLEVAGKPVALIRPDWAGYDVPGAIAS